MADEPPREDVQAAADRAIGVFLSELGSDLATGKFALLVEALDEDGKRGLWMVTHPDQTAWETLGLLQYGIQCEQSANGNDE
jgi:hypothetical protein